MRETEVTVYGFRDFDTQTLYQEGMTTAAERLLCPSSKRSTWASAKTLRLLFPVYDDIQVEMVLEYLEAPTLVGKTAHVR